MKNIISKSWYSLTRIFSYNCNWNIIIGKRSNGKTYSVKKYIVDMLATYKNSQFVYMRRLHKYCVRDNMIKLFDDIKDYCVEMLGDTISFSTARGFYLTNDPDKKTIGDIMTLDDMTTKKGISYDSVKTILFDEFLDDNGYMDNEINLFLNCISTIVRARTDVKIFILGNTITEYCPYFKLFKIDVKKLKKGHITYIEHKKGARVVVEYCRDTIMTKESEKEYMGFDDTNETCVIVDGDWETDNLTTKEIDGINWSYKHRKLIPVYFSGMDYVFEISITKNLKFPIVFIRRLNTQNGMVNENVKINLSLDETIIKNKNGIVPTFGKPSELMGEGLINMLRIFDDCLRCGRAIYTNALDGTRFLTIYNEIIKR